MSVAEDNRQQFIDKFNELLGSKTGKPLSKVGPVKLSQAQVDKAAKMLAPKAKVIAKKITKQVVKQAGSPTDAATLLGLKTSAGGLSGGGETLPDLNTGPTHSSGGSAWSGLKHAWKSIDNAVTNNPVTNAIQDNPLTRLAANPIKEGLDIVSRPSYMVEEALNRTQKGINENDGIWDLGKDFMHGAWAGVTGKKKTGFGDVVQTASEFDPNKVGGLNRILAGHLGPLPSGGEVIHNMEKTNPTEAKWIKRGLGVVGDVAFDPTTYLSGGTVTAAREATVQGIRHGAEALGKEAIKETATRAFKRVLNDTGHVHLVNRKVLVKVGSPHIPLFDNMAKKLSEVLDNITYDLKSGKVIGGDKSIHGTLAHAAAEITRDEYFKVVAPARNKFVIALKRGKVYSKGELNKLRKSNPLFGEWLDSAEQVTQDALSKSKHLGHEEIAALADEHFLTKLAPKIDEVHAQMVGALKDATLKIPHIRMMGQDTYLPRLGKVIDKTGKRLVENPKVANFNRAFRYSSQFPGYATHIAQKVKSLNMGRYEEFKKEVEDVFHQTTPEQRTAIHKAIEEGRTLTGHDGVLQDFVQRKYHQMYKEEIGVKARSASATPEATNYVYNHVNSFHPEFDAAWRNPKKLNVFKTKSIDGFTSTELAGMGYKKVETDAAQALLLRKQKQLRELTKGEFRKDLATHYGFKSIIPEGQARQRGMVQIDKTKYPDLYKGLAPNEKLYIDQGIENIYNNFVELTKGSSKTPNVITKSMEEAVKVFKTANTIYWPGFHIRNAVSDIFMGALDGVKSSRYAQVFKAMVHKDTAFLKVGGENVPFRRVYDSYYDNAASAGYYDSEMKRPVNKVDLSTNTFMDALRYPNRITNKLRTASTIREDFGRLVHYYHALDDEYSSLISKGVGKDKAWKGAEEAALSRVNKYKFDYNALTKEEQGIRKYGIPFYTYMRKAVPVLVENLFMNPKYFSYISKMQNSLAPSEEFQGASLPSWMKDLSFSQLSSGDEPVGFTDALLPTRTLQEAFTNPLSRINPVAQGIIEYNTGKDLFTGRAVGTGVKGATDILKNKWRAVSTYHSIESDSKPTLEKWAGFFGIPIVQVTKARQNGRTKELEHQLTTKVTKINGHMASKGLKLSVRKGKIYVVQPKSPTPDEIRFGSKPKYPINPKEKVIGIYNTFDEIPKV